MIELAGLVETAVLQRQGKREGNEIRFLCPCHDDHHPSARYNPQKQTWYCDVCQAGGGIKDLASQLDIQGNGRRELVRRVEYTICNPLGELVASHVRLEYNDGEKSFLWERNGVSGLGGLKVADLPLFNSEKISKYSENTPCVICEGEKPAVALEGLGFLSLGTVTGASSTPSIEGLRPIAQRSGPIYLWADNDTSGKSHMEQIAARLQVLGKSCRLIHWADAPAKGDAADFVAMDGTVAKLERLASEAPEWKPPQDKAEAGFRLTKPATPWPEPLAEEAFHGLAGEVVRAIEPHTEGDSAALLTNFLVAFGNSIGRGQHARAEADRHSCNLNIVQVGETSKGRKGSALGHIRELFNRVYPAWTEQRIASGLSSGEGLIWEVRDPIEKTVKGEVTVVDEGITDKRLLVCEAEFSAPLRIMAREGNTLSATIRQAWDSGVLRILTKNSPAKATGAHISILGHVTKAELLRYLNDIEAGNGFANRFLWVCVKRARVLPEGGGCPSYQEIVPKLKATIDRARNIGELKRDATARGLWAEIYPELSEGKPGLLGAVTARAEAQVLRLSVIYAVLDGAGEIRPAHLMAALAVWDYCEASSRYIFGDALGDSIADRIQGALRQSPEGLSRTNIYQLFSKHTSAARIEQALGLLQTTERVRYEVRKTEGRPVEVWQAV